MTKILRALGLGFSGFETKFPSDKISRMFSCVSRAINEEAAEEQARILTAFRNLSIKFGTDLRYDSGECTRSDATVLIFQGFATSVLNPVVINFVSVFLRKHKRK